MINYRNHTTPKKSEQVFSYSPSLQDEDLPTFALQIFARHIESRINPNQIVNLEHLKIVLKISNPVPLDQAQQILKPTRYWNFFLDKDRKPRCAEELRLLINSVVAGGDLQ